MHKPRILLVADGRSPIVKNWIKMLLTLDYAVHLASTFPCEAIDGIDSQETIPVGFSHFAGGQVGKQSQKNGSLKKQLISAFRPIFLYVRALLTPLMLDQPQASLLAYVEKVEPDIVHALRIPFEGMLAKIIPPEIPLVVSIWGNDLTMHARTTGAMNQRTRETLARADALMADASRDIKIAGSMGLQKGAPTCVVPGSGGLDMRMIKDAPQPGDLIRKNYLLPKDAHLIVNPRGFRPGSVHQDVFFASIPLVLEKFPDVHFVCPGMAGQSKAEKWIVKYDIADHITLLPFLSQKELWEIYKQSELYVSLSSHDGTPNSFLEAIACGCFPIVGDILSLREWIIDGENGLLVNPKDKRSAANAMIRVLNDKVLQENAAEKNEQIILSRTDRNVVSQIVKVFYEELLLK